MHTPKRVLSTIIKLGLFWICGVSSLVSSADEASVSVCGKDGVAVQVLGSGGPEITYDKRASSGYLIWIDGTARVLVDAGSGVAANFGRSGALFENLDAIVLSHLHVDHSADLPALIKASYFGPRRRNLPLFGPTENQLMPSTSQYVASLLGSDGAFKYLFEYVDTEIQSDYKLQPFDIKATQRAEVIAFKNQRLELRAVPVTHGPLPALAWRVNVGSKSISFSGDMSGARKTFRKLAKGTDVLVAHNAIPQSVNGGVTKLHMRPSTIGDIAAHAEPKQLLLSHRMRRSQGQEEQTLSAIRARYSGPVRFANDMDCIELP